MKHLCIFCNSNFERKYTLDRHLKENRCESFKKMTAFDVSEMIKSFKSTLVTNVNQTTHTTHNTHNTHIENVENLTINIEKIEIVNSINKLDASYIEPIKMKELIEGYSYPKLNLLLSNYIKDIICNKDHPENHSIKYVKKKPPTYNSVMEDSDGNLINVIKNLNDSCIILTEPILETLKSKLKQYIKHYKNEDDYDKEAVDDIYKELNKEAVKNALKSVLQNDILNDIQMKFCKIK
jgi:hypothetical protein